MRKSESGQTIIEAVVALAAVLVIVAAIAVAIVTSVNNSQFIKSQNLANKYAQQGMEYVRRIQAEDINAFASYSGPYSYDEDGTLTEGAATVVNIGNTHIRQIDFSDDEEPCINQTNLDDPNLELKKVTVTVRWSSGKCDGDDRFCHESNLVTCIPYESTVNAQP